MISGINDIRLISSPIQIPNHEWDVIEIKVLKIKKDIRNILFQFKIKKKRLDFYKWSMNPLALLAYFFLRFKDFSLFKILKIFSFFNLKSYLIVYDAHKFLMFEDLVKF